MKYTPEERMDIGRRLYLKELTYREAMVQYGLSETCVHKYMADYKIANGIPLENEHHPARSATISRLTESIPDIDAYRAMSKEELINELILAKANELRAKKGYEVKGVGANKEFISLNSRNTKS